MRGSIDQAGSTRQDQQRSTRLEALLSGLSGILDKGAIIAGDAVGDGYRGDATDTRGERPALGLRPRTTAEVAAILARCNDLRQPIVIQGGRTGLAGGARPLAGEISLSLERMTGLDAVDTEAATVVAEAGVTLQAVQEAAADAGLMFGVDIGARGSSTVGGNVATNAGGIRVLRYGMYRAQVLGLEVVLADGAVLSGLKGLPKDNSGFDLNQIFIGSEGTLGVVTRACLRLHPAPRTQANAVCALPSLAAAITLLKVLRQRLGPALSAFEIIFPSVYEGVLAHTRAQPPVPAGAGMYALIEMQAQEDGGEAQFASVLMDAYDEGLVGDVTVSGSPREFHAIWALREGASAFIFSMDHVIGFDVSLPLATMQRFVDEASAEVAALDPKAAVYVFGHLGDGNLHFLVRSRQHDRIAAATLARVAALGGSISAEHGIGLEKKPWLSLVRSPAEIAAMRRLKAAFDPNTILNPGRVFDMTPVTPILGLREHL